MSVSAANISSLGCGATIPVAYYPKDIEQLRQIQRRHAARSRLFIAGALSNTLVLEMTPDDATIFCSAMRGIRVHEDCITVRAGEKTAHVADVARICGGTYNAGALTKSGDALISHVTARSEALTGLVDLAVTTAFAAGLLPDGMIGKAAESSSFSGPPAFTP